jgi:alkylhydroperoxidase family enzyme
MDNQPKRDGGARLPLTDHEDRPEAAHLLEHVRERTGRVLNLHRMLAYAPKLMKANSELVMALRFEVTLPRDLVEICILRTAHLAGSDYEWHQHVPMALVAGVPQVKIDTLEAWQTSPQFSDAERSALAFTESVVSGKTLDATAFAELRRHYSPQQIVELSLLVGQYLATARFIASLSIPIEEKRS